jgi:ATP-dependent Clp protease ATP-binding subunit ClpA
VTQRVSPGFSTLSRAIIVRAVAEAREARTEVDDDCILLGLLTEGDCAAATILKDRGLSAEHVRAELRQGRLTDAEAAAHVPFTPSARQAVRRAGELAAHGGHQVSAEHLLLGLIDNFGSAATLMTRRGLSVHDIRAELRADDSDSTST